MSGRTVTRTDLVDALIKEVGLPHNHCAELLENVLSQIVGCLEKSEPLKIAKFGTFSVRQKNARIGRNPKTGEEVTIQPRKVVMFRPSQTLKKRTSQGAG